MLATLTVPVYYDISVAKISTCTVVMVCVVNDWCQWESAKCLSSLCVPSSQNSSAALLSSGAQEKDQAGVDYTLLNSETTHTRAHTKTHVHTRLILM